MIVFTSRFPVSDAGPLYITSIDISVPVLMVSAGSEARTFEFKQKNKMESGLYVSPDEVVDIDIKITKRKK